MSDFPDYRDPQEAFDNAIARHHLSTNEKSWRFAGNYMYMGDSDGKALFKHIDTRQYYNMALEVSA